MSDTVQPGLVAGIATTTSKVVLAHYEKFLTAVLAVFLLNGQAWLNLLPTPPVPAQPKVMVEKAVPDPRVAVLEKALADQEAALAALRDQISNLKSVPRPKRVTVQTAK